jgi:hypothetical protein
MTYCTHIECPYSHDCDRSARLIAGKAGVYSFADFSDVCEKYAAYKNEESREEIADG